MELPNIPLFGEELENISFDGVSDWLINVKPIAPFWYTQPTYIIAQISFTIGAISTLVHALSNGGRWPYLWLGTILHGLVVESICYIHPDVDNYWHSQSPIMLFGRRHPLHIFFLYPCFIYQAAVAVNKLKLPWWAESFAVGATAVLIDMPYDITSVKFVHWTWHDTDPNIGDRHYWVPWNSYYFHCSFASSFTFWFHFAKHFQSPNHNTKWESSGILSESKTMIIASFLGTPGGILMFLPIYHPLHDIAGIHSEVTFFILFSLVLVIIWSGDRLQKSNTAKTGNDGGLCTILLSFSLAVHYLTYLLIVTFGKPENEISIGLHEPTGPCNITKPHHTAFGTVLHKREYLCVDDYNEDYFDFSCVPSGPPRGIVQWYTICGTPFENRTEYIAIIGTICMIATVYFYNAHYRDINKRHFNELTKKHD